MAKRKSSSKAKAKQQAKKKAKLETAFSCPFCGHEGSVECNLDKKVTFVGRADCNICQESYLTNITDLTEPIDLYYVWIDECEKVNNPESDGAESSSEVNKT